MSTAIEKINEKTNNLSNIKDPLIKRKVTECIRMIDISGKFKRIDISFLQMTDQNSGNPKFAILPYQDFLDKKECRFDKKGWNNRFSNLVTNEGWGEAICKHQKEVPETVKAIVDEQKGHFDEILVAWEAEWNTAQKDPIVLGRIADLFFIVAKWDLSNLESYIVSEF